jgi:hypothetical protein
MAVMIAFFWDVTLSIPQNNKRRFRGTCSHLQGSNLKTEETHFSNMLVPT